MRLRSESAGPTPRTQVVERLATTGDTRLLEERSLTFMGSSLALIQLDLERAPALAGSEMIDPRNLRPASLSPLPPRDGPGGRDDGRQH